MKTYWLQQREARTPLRRALDPPMSDLEGETLDIRYNSTTTANEDRRGMYSPITFQDVARRSIASSPSKDVATSRECRSNSVGAVYSASRKTNLSKSPSNIFGSFISNSGFSGSTANTPNSPTSATRRKLTPPSAKKFESASTTEKASTAGILVKRNSINPDLMNRQDSLKNDNNCTCNRCTNLENDKKEDFTLTATSKSDGNLVEASKKKVHSKTSGPLTNPNHLWKDHKDMCCPAFNSKRHRLHSNVCVIC